METPFINWVFSGHVFYKATATALVTSAVLRTIGGQLFVAASAATITYRFYEQKKARAAGQGDDERAAADDFHRLYGIRRDAIRSQSSSMIPLATRFHDLKQGDTLLEIVLKTKRGTFACDSDDMKMRALLQKILSYMPGGEAEKAMRLKRAVASTRIAMNSQVTMTLLGSWAESARREGSERYQFGDFTKSIISKITGTPRQSSDQKLDIWLRPASDYMRELQASEPRAPGDYNNCSKLVDDSSLTVMEHVCLHFVASSASRFAYHRVMPESEGFEWGDDQFVITY